jgi:predicted peptidase
LAQSNPDRYAAIVTIAAGGDPADVKRISKLPVWDFHGAKDSAVPLARSEEMAKALKQVGAKDTKFTVYPEAGHDSWTETYKNPAVYEWLLKHQR